MKFESLTPNLIVEDVNHTVEYYEDHLGFTLLMTVPETGNFDWAMMKRNEVVMMFQNLSSVKSSLVKRLSPGSTGSGVTLYIKIAGLEDFYKKIEDKVEVVSELESTFYGALEFSILDLNGYVITFSEDID